MKKFANIFILDTSPSMNDRLEEGIRRIEGAVESLNLELNSINNNVNEDVLNYTEIWTFATACISDQKRIGPGLTHLLPKINGNGTALYNTLVKVLSEVPEGFDGGFVNILTDGQDNSSSAGMLARCKDLIQKFRDMNWMITFQGANEESLEESSNIGLAASNTRGFGSRRSLNDTANANIAARAAYTSNVQKGLTFTADSVVLDAYNAIDDSVINGTHGDQNIPENLNTKEESQ